MKEDHKELEFIKKNTQGIYHVLRNKVKGFHDIREVTGINKPIRAIVKTVKEMEKQDKEAMKR